MILCSHIDPPPPLYNQYKFRAHLSPPHLTPTTRLLSLQYARVRLCTKLKVISENSDYGISGSHLEFFVPVWSSKSHEISGKKPLEHWRPLLLPLLLLWWPTEFWPKVWPNTYLVGTNHQCERVDYNLIIGFSLSVFRGCRCLMLLLR